MMATGKVGPARDGLIGALLHGLEILEMFDRDRTVIGIGEMARHLGLHRSTASRLAATLASVGYLAPAGEPGRYRLAGKLAVLGELATSGGGVRRVALPYLTSLVEELGETGHLAVLEGNEAVTVEVVDGWHSVRMHSWVGKRSPAHCSSMGKALLAGRSADDIGELYPGPALEARTANTITDPARLKRCLAEVRRLGYAVDREELEVHLCCVAAPVFDRTGRVVASISVSGPASRIHEAGVASIAPAVCRAAWQISERLGAPRHIPGWSPPPDDEADAGTATTAKDDLPDERSAR
jgi:DNA-binding IclR family transcriptional regulator